MTLPENLSAQRAAWRRDLLARRAGMVLSKQYAELKPNRTAARQ